MRLRHEAGRAWRQERRTERRALAVVALLVVGTLGLLGGVHVLLEAHEATQRMFTGDAGLLLLGVLGALLLGAGGARATLPLRTRLPDLALAVVGGVLAAGVAWLYVCLMRRLAPEVEAEELARTWPVIVLLVGTTPLLEEWLCRGVLWAALERLVGGRATLVTSAALFALLHGLNGAAWLELPHRFAAGLVFGWLRRRSGGLPAPILAHAVLNALALWIAG